MMTDYERAKLFFPQTRRELLVQDISLLETSGGEKRIRLELIMPFGDNKLVGMPSYIGDEYDHLVKEDSVASYSKLNLEFEAMSYFVFTTEDHDKAAQTLYNVHMTSFTMNHEKKKKDELADIYMKFVALVPSNPKLWSWLYPYHRNSIFVRFEPTQTEMEPEKPAEADKQLKLGDDGYEKERRRATSKSQDAQFANA